MAFFILLISVLVSVLVSVNSASLWISPFFNLRQGINKQIIKRLNFIGSKRLLDNKKFAIWELILEPNESSMIHRHDNDYSFYVKKGSDLAIYDINDNKILQFKCKPGESYSFKLNKKTNTLIAEHDHKIKFPATHKAKNIGLKPFEEIIIETKY